MIGLPALGPQRPAGFAGHPSTPGYIDPKAASVASRAAEPDADESAECYEDQEAVDRDEQRRGNARRVGVRGGGAPEKSWRQTAAPKEKALNRTRIVPTAQIIHSGTTPTRSFLAPTPLASAASPVRTQAA